MRVSLVRNTFVPQRGLEREIKAHSRVRVVVPVVILQVVGPIVFLHSLRHERRPEAFATLDRGRGRAIAADAGGALCVAAKVALAAIAWAIK